MTSDVRVRLKAWRKVLETGRPRDLAKIAPEVVRQLEAELAALTKPPAYTIETFSRVGLRGRRHYFRIRATNGQTVAQSEGYANKGDRDMTAGHLRASLIEAEIRDEGDLP